MDRNRSGHRNVLELKFVAKRLRKYSEVAGNAITLPDFFSNRFQRRQAYILMSVAAIIILLFFCIYCGSCFVTCGKLSQRFFGLDYTTMMILGALVVFVYTFVGRLSFGLYDGPLSRALS